MKYKKALLVGRFQPFHLGHLYLLKKALEVAGEVVIGVGSANIYDSNNPLDWKTREKILKAVIYKEGMELRVSKIVPLDDFFNDEKWLKNVKDKVGDFDLVVGNNDWVNGIMEKGGIEVLRVPYYKRYLYEGEKIRKLLVKKGNWQARVPSYLVQFITENLTENVDEVVLGGTFDHFHKGHRAMLDKAFTIGKKVTVGIATEELYKDKMLSKEIEPFSVRKKSVRDYLASKSWLYKAKLIAFSDFKGPLDTKKNASAIVVSRQTLPNALRINRLRVENNLPPLKTIVVGDVLAQDGKMVSSERIRKGEIDREGYFYLKMFEKKLIMPESLRERLRRPLGKVIKGKLEEEVKIAKKVAAHIDKAKPTMIIAVGDVIADSLEKIGLKIGVKVIDLKSRREFIGKINVMKTNEDRIINEAGTITTQAVMEIKKAIDNKLNDGFQEVVIDGEEDLLTLPTILFAPLGSIVLYGHWRLGVIMVGIDESIKKKVTLYVREFDTL